MNKETQVETRSIGGGGSNKNKVSRTVGSLWERAGNKTNRMTEKSFKIPATPRHRFLNTHDIL